MYDVGDTVPLSFTVTDTTEKKVAATVVLTVTLPDATTATPSVSTPSVGIYTATYTPSQAGRHTYRWVASGAASKTGSAMFNVRSAAPTGIISVDDARAHLRMTAADEGVEDEELAEVIEAASRAVERHVGHVVARRTVTERHYVRGCGSSSLVTIARPILSLTSVKSIDGATTWTTSNLDLNNDAGILYVRAGNLFHGPLEVIFVAGQTIVPENYVEATEIIVAHLWEIQRSATLGRTTARSVFGANDQESLMTPGGVGFAIPHRAIELLGGRPPLVG